MFERIGQVAEQMATNVSRRQFLGRFGQGALTLAAAVAGLVALPRIALGGKPICGPGSAPGCVGEPEGFGCFGGNCKRSPGSSDCACWTPRPPRR